MPDHPGLPAHRRLSIRAVFRTPGIRPTLATIFAWMTARDLLDTYIAPFAALAGLQRRIDLLLLAFGVAALAGIWITGILVDRMLRRLALASLLGFVAVPLALGLCPTNPAVTATAAIVWGLSFGGAAT